MASKVLERINISGITLIGLIVLYALSVLNCFWVYRSAFAFVPALGMPIFLGTIALILFSLRNKIRISSNLLFTLALATLGIFFIAAFPPFMVPDSFFHYRSSYMYSNIIMGLPPCEGMDIPMRLCDIEFSNAFLEAGLELNRSHYELLGNHSFWVAHDGDIVLFEQESLRQFNEQFGTTTAASFPYLSANPFQLRVASAIGMTLGRLLGLGALPVFYLGEAFDLALYVFLVGYAAKIMPTGSRILMAVSLFPMTLHLAASYSYDVAIIGMSFLLIALVTKLVVCKNPADLRDKIAIAALAVLIAPCKMVYIVLAALVFIIPSQRFSSRKRSVGYKALVVALAVLSLLAFRYAAIIQLIDDAAPGETTEVQVAQTENEAAQISAEDDPSNNTDASTASTIETEEAVEPTSQPITLDYILEHPGHAVSLFAGTLNLSADDYLGTTIGFRLAWLRTNIQAPWWLVMLFIGTAIMAMLPHKNEKMLSFSQRGGYFAVGIAIIVLIPLSFALTMTSVEDKCIIGMQGRYFLPVLPLVLMAIAPKSSIEAKMDLTNTILLSSTILNVMYLSHIFSVAMAS